jgi:hypothetical protein
MAAEDPFSFRPHVRRWPPRLCVGSGSRDLQLPIRCRDQHQQFRNGSHIEIDGKIFRSSSSSTPGRARAGLVRTKLRRIEDGSVQDKTFAPAEFRPVRTESRKMQYL